MDQDKAKKEIEVLAELLEKANGNKSDPLGRCDWTDADGNLRCNNFSEFQCQQVGGLWISGQTCPGREQHSGDDARTYIDITYQTILPGAGGGYVMTRVTASSRHPSQTICATLDVTFNPAGVPPTEQTPPLSLRPQEKRVIYNVLYDENIHVKVAAAWYC